jgi:phage terminase large subunit GpA-like protein
MSDVVTCPKCGYRFSRSYARVTSCEGCPDSVLSCPFIKCPKCGHEFRW